MKAVSLFDSFITAIRETRFTNDEALQLIQELRAMYPEVFNQSGIDSEQFPTDFKERIGGDVNYRGHMIDAESEESEDLEEL